MGCLLLASLAAASFTRNRPGALDINAQVCNCFHDDESTFTQSFSLYRRTRKPERWGKTPVGANRAF